MASCIRVERGQSRGVKAREQEDARRNKQESRGRKRWNGERFTVQEMQPEREMRIHEKNRDVNIKDKERWQALSSCVPLPPLAGQSRHSLQSQHGAERAQYGGGNKHAGFCCQEAENESVGADSHSTQPLAGS